MRILTLLIPLTFIWAQEIQLEKVIENGIFIEAKNYSVKIDEKGTGKLTFKITGNVTLIYTCLKLNEKATKASIFKDGALFYDCGENQYFSLNASAGNYIVNIKSDPGTELDFRIGFK